MPDRVPKPVRVFTPAFKQQAMMRREAGEALAAADANLKRFPSPLTASGRAQMKQRQRSDVNGNCQ